MFWDRQAFDDLHGNSSEHWWRPSAAYLWGAPAELLQTFDTSRESGESLSGKFNRFPFPLKRWAQASDVHEKSLWENCWYFKNDSASQTVCLIYAHVDSCFYLQRALLQKQHNSWENGMILFIKGFARNCKRRLCRPLQSLPSPNGFLHQDIFLRTAVRMTFLVIIHNILLEHSLIQVFWKTWSLCSVILVETTVRMKILINWG